MQYLRLFSRVLFTIACCAPIVAVCASGQMTGGHVPGGQRLLVRHRSEVTSDRAFAVESNNEREHASALVRGLKVITLEAGQDRALVLNELRSRPDVLYADPDYTRRITALPNDPRFVSQWNLLGSSGAGGHTGINTVGAWAFTTGSADVVIGIVDTGVDYTHPDLAANVYHNASDCDNSGVDDDNDGFVDDCQGANALTHAGDAMDDNGHGTAMAGIIGAVGNNGIGISGVNWTVTMLPCKALGANGAGADSDIIACFEYIAGQKDRGVNVVAICAAFSGSERSQALEDAIAELRDRGILLITSAGNNGTDNALFPAYPANYPLANVISVASTNASGSLGASSNFGVTTVHLAAPGEQIVTTGLGGTYVYASGTSAAAAHVAGMAALISATRPTDDWKQIRNRLLTGGDVSAETASTITGRQANVLGSIQCAGQRLFAPISPQRAPVATTVEQSVTFSALHLDCDAPAGELTVDISPGEVHLSLRDDGVAPDEIAGDGLYSETWTPPEAGQFTFRFSNGYSGTINVAPYSPDNPAPVLSSVQPDTWAVDDSPVAIVLRGSGFTQGSVVLWDGAPRSTTYISDGELYVMATAADLALATTHHLAVANALPGGGTSATANFTVRAPDFALRTSLQTVTNKSGDSSVMSVSVEPAPVFRNEVALSCSGLPAGLQCRFAPATAVPGNMPAVITLTIASSQTARSIPTTKTLPWARWAFCSVAFLGLLGRRRTLRRSSHLLALACIALVLTSCGGSGGQNTTPIAPPTTATVTAPITISATGGGITHTQNITLIYTR